MIISILKAKIKKIKVIEDKEKVKIKVKYNKNYKTSQINSIKRLALCKSQIRFFKDILFNPLINLNSNSI